MFTKALSRHKSSVDPLGSNLQDVISRQESLLYFDFCFENFSEICRLCLRNDGEMIEIFDDSSEDRLNASTELVSKMKYTIDENVGSLGNIKFLTFT